MALASLPMYDLPELHAATDAWWQGLARAFRREGLADVPDALDRRPDYQQVLLSPGVLFSQTCGYPLTHALAGKVTLLATPLYAVEGCKAADYCSLVIVGADNPAAGIGDLRGTRCAINGIDSQSGCNALRALVAPLAEGGRFFGKVAVSGGHRASIGLVGSGHADVAAIDCVTHALLSRHRPAALAGTRVLCRTAAAPNLPYVTRAGAADDLLARLRGGLQRAMADPALTTVRDSLMLTGIAVLPLSAYDRVTAMEAAAIAAGYPELA
ncbi:MAG: phosphate/phosphite/phosphonate ABC transporter substrate-binding protein [Dongiaceae bacterium]